MSMNIPCKYFARNECRFGDSCRFYHARGGNNQNIQGAFGGRPFTAGGMGQHQQDVLNLTAKSQQNMETMIEMVKKDMVEWDQGHIFPFSCYGPAGGKPCLPGFEETSVEELRYRFYANNKTPIDLSRESAVAQQARLNYQRITPATRNILERVIVKGEIIPNANWGNNAASPTSNMFGGGGIMSPVSQSTSIFGGASGSQQQASPFGQTSSIFGNTLGNTPTASSSIFGTSQASTNPVFGGNSLVPSGSLFGSVANSQTGFGGGSTVFGNPTSAPSSQGGNFSSTASLFGGGSFLSQPQQQTTPGLFSAQPNINVFGGSPVNQPPQSQPSIFGSPLTATSPQSQFQSPTLQNLLQTGPQSFSGSPSTQQATSVFGGFSQTQNSGLPASGSFFGSSQPSVSTPSNILGGGLSSELGMMATTPKTSLFGTPQLQTQLPTAAVQYPQQSLFGTPTTATTPSQPSLFGTTNPPQQSLFGTPTTITTTTSQPSLFGTNPSQQSLFGTPGPTTTTTPSQPSLFGTTNPPQQSLFGTPTTTTHPFATSQGSTTITQKYVYTDEAELTTEELEAFRAPNFTLENIPIRPPPKSLC